MVSLWGKSGVSRQLNCFATATVSSQCSSFGSNLCCLFCLETFKLILTILARFVMPEGKFNTHDCCKPWFTQPSFVTFSTIFVFFPWTQPFTWHVPGRFRTSQINTRNESIPGESTEPSAPHAHAPAPTCTYAPHVMRRWTSRMLVPPAATTPPCSAAPPPP